MRERRIYSNELELNTEKSIWYNVPRTASRCPNSKLNLACNVFQKTLTYFFKSQYPLLSSPTCVLGSSPQTAWYSLKRASAWSFPPSSLRTEPHKPTHPSRSRNVPSLGIPALFLSSKLIPPPQRLSHFIYTFIIWRRHISEAKFFMSKQKAERTRKAVHRQPPSAS